MASISPSNIPDEAVEAAALATILVEDTGMPYRIALLAAESVLAAGYRKGKK